MVDLPCSRVRRVDFKISVLHKLIYRLVNAFHIRISEACFEEWINWLQNLYESAKDRDYSDTVMKNNNKHGVLLLPDVRTHQRLLWSRQCRMRARVHTHTHTHAEVAQSCPTLCNPMNCSPPGSSTHTGKWVKSQGREPTNKCVLQQTTDFQQTRQTVQQEKWNLLNTWCWNYAIFTHPKVDFTSWTSYHTQKSILNAL